MLSDMIDDLVRADCPQEKEAAYRQLEKLGVDRITADVIADERYIFGYKSIGSLRRDGSGKR